MTRASDFRTGRHIVFKAGVSKTNHEIRTKGRADMNDNSVIPQPNDVWEDLDRRSEGRRMKVIAIEGDKAIVHGGESGEGRMVKIRLDRFKASKGGKKGYKLISRERPPIFPEGAPEIIASFTL
jgi:hypothetical protein